MKKLLVFLLAVSAFAQSQKKCDGDLALICAAEDGRLAEVQALVAGHAPLNVQRPNGWTALHAAARAGNLPIVRALAAAGADVHIRTKIGDTAADIAREAVADCTPDAPGMPTPYCPTSQGFSSAKLADYRATATYLKGITD